MTPLKGVITCHTLCSKKHFCVVYDATFYFFLLDKRSFFIDCAGFLDKTIIFAVQNMIPVSKIVL